MVSGAFGRAVRPLTWRVLCLVVLAWLGSPTPAEAQFGALVSPGKLAKAHASLEGLSNCEKCHERGKKVSAPRCLSCHAPIAERIARKFGVHRDVKDDCVSCHVEHAGVDGQLRPFDAKTFNHAAQTGFALDGKHAAGAANCALCHKERSLVTLKSACVSCHTDVHKGALGNKCESCHSTQVAFTAVRSSFDHKTTAFPLVGAHQTVACAKCHTTPTFKGVKFASCADCHRSPHAATVSKACLTCHSNDTWTTKKFDHSKTTFPLVGKHVSVECASCHKQPATKVKPAAGTCAVCHSDPHKGTFKQDCKACHSEKSFAGAPFDHVVTKFPLTDGHAGVACRACHTSLSDTRVPLARKALDFRGAQTGCVTCHADPHASKLGPTCTSCHTTKSFAVTTFTHTTSPGLFGGQHASLACVACHKPAGTSTTSKGPVLAGRPSPSALATATFGGTPTKCASCHQDVHLGQLGSACESCHTVGAAKFAAPKFSHANTAYPLTGKHAAVTCAKCHRSETGQFGASTGTTVRFKGLGTACATCHADVHLGQITAKCETCHRTETFRVASYTHASPPSGFFVGRHMKATCAACHKPVTGSFPGGRGTAVQFSVGTKCVSCHTDVHNGAMGDDCSRCHKPEPDNFAHEGVRTARAFARTTQVVVSHAQESATRAGQTKGTTLASRVNTLGEY